MNGALLAAGAVKLFVGIGIGGLGVALAWKLLSRVLSRGEGIPLEDNGAAGILHASALISLGLRIFADGASALEKVAQELAAGMAGWIGDDLWYLLRNFLGLGFKKWEPSRDYEKGAQVKYDGKLYRSSRALGATTATPDRDPSWVLIEGRAQGFRHEDLRDFAQLLASDRERWQATAIDTLNRIGPHLEEVTGHRFDDEQKGRLINSMTEVLQQAVRE